MRFSCDSCGWRWMEAIYHDSLWPVAWYIYNYIYILMNIYIYIYGWCEMMWGDLIFGCRCLDSPRCRERYIPDPLGWNLSHQRLSRINVWPWPHSNWIRLWKTYLQIKSQSINGVHPHFWYSWKLFCYISFIPCHYVSTFFLNPMWWVLLLIFLFGWWFGTCFIFHKLGILIPFE